MFLETTRALLSEQLQARGHADLALSLLSPKFSFQITKRLKSTWISTQPSSDIFVSFLQGLSVIYKLSEVSVSE